MIPISASRSGSAGPRSAKSSGMMPTGKLFTVSSRSNARMRPSWTIRPDTLFIPFHYGHRQSVNQLTNPAVDPTVKIPEYKACAATIERLDAPSSPSAEGPRVNLTPENAPKMFPYTVGETKAPPEKEGKAQ